MAALALPQESAAAPALAALAPHATAAAPEGPEASTPAAEASPASDAGAAQDAEAAAFVAAQEAQEAPLAAQPELANSSLLAGGDCSSTLDLLDSHSSFSIFRSLITTAGKPAPTLPAACRPWSTLVLAPLRRSHVPPTSMPAHIPTHCCRPGGRPHLDRPADHFCTPQQVGCTVLYVHLTMVQQRMGTWKSSL